MRLDQAFQKAGFVILAANKSNDGKTLVFDVRVPLEGEIPSRWKLTIEEMLVVLEASESKGKATWSVDIVKRFYARNGVVRYNWRITMKGNLNSCQALFVQSVLASLRSGRELTEAPLNGNVDLTPRPGSTRGAYARDDDDRGSRAVAAAMSGDVGRPFRPMEDSP